MFRPTAIDARPGLSTAAMRPSALVLGTLVALAVMQPVHAADLTGKPRVVDGDTLEIAGHRVRLFGIDSPQAAQTCTLNGTQWGCGREAAFALAFETAEHWVQCTERGRDAGGEIIAVCRIGPYDLAERMVRRGWARAQRHESHDYLSAEAEARRARLGLWRAR